MFLDVEFEVAGHITVLVAVAGCREVAVAPGADGVDGGRATLCAPLSHTVVELNRASVVFIFVIVVAVNIILFLSLS